MADDYVISYNENEKAFILERRVRIPIVGKKMRLLSSKEGENVERKGYVYYVSDKPTPEEEQLIRANLHKPHRLPMIDRKR